MKGKEFLFIILLSLFFYANSYDFSIWEGDRQEIRIPKKQFTAQYVVFNVFGKYKEDQYILSAYSDNQKTQRVQLEKSKEGQIRLVLSKDDFKETIYAYIECKTYRNNYYDYNKCCGEYQYYFVDTIKLSNGEPINYYISKEKTILEFTINTSNYDYLNIWIRGQYNYESYFTSEEEQKQIEVVKSEDNYGNYYILRGNQSEVTLNVLAYDKGDYINVGYIGYNHGLHSISNITKNGLTLTGFLKKSILNEVCFNYKYYSNISSLIVNGQILTHYARLYITSENETNILVDNPIEIDSFKLRYDSPKKGQKICVTFPESQEKIYNEYKELIFTIQISQLIYPSYISDSFLFYEPQLNGVTYLRTVPGRSLSIIPFQNNGDFQKLTFNMIAINGSPGMLIMECDDYPLCLYNINYYIRDREAISFNGFSSIILNKTYEGFNESPISEKQYFLFIVCSYEDCNFKSLIYKNNDDISLSEDTIFKKLSPQNQEDNYKIYIPIKTVIKQINIEIATYFGEIEFNNTYLNEKNLRYEEKNEINTKLIQIDFNNELEDELFFSVITLSKTYYTILVTIKRTENNIKTLEEGMTYLLTIDPSNQKNIIKYSNEGKHLNYSFMVNFYPLNCRIEVKDILNNAELKKYENYYYQIVNPEDTKYLSTTYDYQINIKSGDISGNNLCKIYTSGIEDSERHKNYFFDSIDNFVQDNIPQQIIFNQNSKNYSLGYAHINYKNDLLVKFNLKHSAKYKIKLFVFDEESPEEETIVGDDLLYLKSSSWEEVCNSEEICYLHLFISLEMAKDENSDNILEITAKSIDSNSVTYIPKNIMKKDYIQNKKNQNYYTELGENEEGFVIVNFLRGSGKALAKIVSKKEIEIEPNSRWKSKLPTEDDTLEINPLTNRIIFNSGNDACKNGCFLLITVVSDIQDNSKDIRNYPYTLIVHSHEIGKDFINSPSIITPLNSYIIGSIGTKSYSEFYSFWLNSDADRVLIDLQSSIGGLSIYLGEDKETIEINNIEKETLYNKPRGSPYLLSLDKEVLLKKFNEKNNEKRESIKDLVLNIAVWTDLVDSIYEAPFAFSVALQNNGLEIIKVNSDQKSLCNVVRYQGIYRCLYIIEYDFLNEKSNDLFISANVKDKSALFNIYAKNITSDYYELALSDDINKYLPSKNNHDYPLEDQNTNYIYIKDWDNKNEYILVSVEVITEDESTSVELITHIPLAQTDILPNSANSQLLTVEKDKIISLNTSEKYMPFIGITCIGGSGEIYWKSKSRNRYYLKGRDDRLQITTKNKNEVLMIKGTGDLDENYGMVFILYYNLKPFETELAPLALDGSVRYIYNDIDFPISYCSSIKELNEDNNKYYDFFFTLDKLDSKDNQESIFFAYDPFEIFAYIVEQSFIAEKKLNPDIEIPGTISVIGSYDQTMRTGIVRVPRSSIEEAKGIQNPYLYLEIGADKQVNPLNYKEINIETTMSKSNSLIPVSELTNQFGFLGKDEDKRNFILRNDKSKKYLILEFSSENDYLIPSFPGNDKIKGNEFIYGKTFYYLETKLEEDLIDFEISRNPKVPINDEAYFMFKYTFKDDKNYKKYNFKDTKLKVTKKNTNEENVFNYSIELTALDDWRKYTLSYIARIIEEEMPKKSYLSLKPVPQKSNEYENPKIDSQTDKLILEIPNVKIYNKEYVQVILKIKSDESVEYLSYDLQNQWESDSPIPESETPQSETSENGKIIYEDDDDDTTLIVVVSCVGGVIIILVAILILFVFTYSKKTKDLLDQVNSVSFKADKDKDTLLLSDDKNALE